MATPVFQFNLSSLRRRASGTLAMALFIAAPLAASADPEFVGPPPAFAVVESPEPDAVAASNAPVHLGTDEQVEAPTKQTPAAPTESLPLGRPARSALSDLGASDAAPANTGAGWWAQTTAALVFVIGLIFALRWGAQRMARRAGGIAWQMGPAGRAPSGVLEVLGRYPVARGQSLVLLKMDRRILLLGQTSAGFSTLSEIENPEEVASLLVKTRDDEGASMAARFNELLRDMERDPAVGSDTQEIHSGEPATGPRLPRIGLKGVTA